MRRLWAIVVCAFGVAAAWSGAATAAADDPFALPLLQFSDLRYVGGFRLPDAIVNGHSFSYGGGPVAYNPQRNSLFVGSAGGGVAEISIPAPSANSDIRALPFASILQGFADPTEGMMKQVAGNGVTLDGLLVHDNRLYGAASIFYDANNTQRVSHFSRSTDLSASSFSGWSAVWRPDFSGFVSGFMALVPAVWQGVLGGPAVTGQCCVAIAWRTSWGPAAFAFNPQSIGQDTVAARPLLYYPADHPTIGTWSSAGPLYGGATQVNGVALLNGTRTALFVGRNGTGPFCYGNGTADRSLVGTRGSDNEIFCYDPAYPGKGQHSYPYEYQMWAYDMKDFAAVAAGSKQPWDIVPYGAWPFAFPFGEPKVAIGGVGYDPQRQLLYISQLYADADGYASRPLIHVFSVSAPAASAPPATSRTVANVTLTADKQTPQAAGTAISFTAQPTGGTAPYQYKWLIFDGVASTVAANWTTSNRLTWTPSTANANYRVTVWVRGAGNTADALEASATAPFAITPMATTTTSVTLVANRVAPQPPLTAITWTATPVGGVAPHQYKWLVADGAATAVAVNWSATNSFTWTPSSANANYRVTVWVRSAGNTADAAETSTSAPFPIAAVSTPAPPTATPTPPVISRVTITANKPSPQPAGTEVKFTTEVVGGVAPYQYQYWTLDSGRWSPVGNWINFNTLQWIRNSFDSPHQIAVRVRSAGSTNDQGEATATIQYVLTAPNK